MKDGISRSVSIFVIWVLCCAQVTAQTSLKAGAVEELRVSRRVSITDPAGTPIQNVNASDIRIFENGQEQQVSDLRLEGSPLSLVMVFDNTGSIRPYLDAITEAGKYIIRNLRPADEVEVIRFVSSTKIEVLQRWTTDRIKLIDAVENQFTEGGQSAVVDGLMKAALEIEARRETHPSHRFAVLLVSDCEDRDSFFNYRQLLVRAKITAAPFFVISYPNELRGRLRDDAIRFSYELPLVTGGSTYFPRDKETRKLPLGESLRDLLIELRAPYVISYVPTDQARDGKKRTVKIERAGAEQVPWLITTGSGYTVPSSK